MSYTYVGSELDLFAAAINWKSYFRDQVAPYLGHDVLEVGAGLRRDHPRPLPAADAIAGSAWSPTPSLADRLIAAIRAGDLPDCCRDPDRHARRLDDAEPFDTILYMDVLEHIEDDRAEVARAAGHLRPGGHLIVLSPAHQWLFTPFDAAIGHYRRYTKGTLRAAAPPGLPMVRLAYLDSVGLFASLGNRLVLRSAMPNPDQIAVWDRFLVPLSYLADPLLGHSVGKSVLAVWRKTS